MNPKCFSFTKKESDRFIFLFEKSPMATCSAQTPWASAADHSASSPDSLRIPLFPPPEKPTLPPQWLVLEHKHTTVHSLTSGPAASMWNGLSVSVGLQICPHIRGQGEIKEKGRLVGGSFNKQGTYIPGLSWAVARQAYLCTHPLES